MCGGGKRKRRCPSPSRAAFLLPTRPCSTCRHRPPQPDCVQLFPANPTTGPRLLRHCRPNLPHAPQGPAKRHSPIRGCLPRPSTRAPSLGHIPFRGLAPSCSSLCLPLREQDTGQGYHVSSAPGCPELGPKPQMHGQALTPMRLPHSSWEKLQGRPWWNSLQKPGDAQRQGKEASPHAAEAGLGQKSPRGLSPPLLPRPVLSVWPPKPSWNKEAWPWDEWVRVLDALSIGGHPPLCH